MSRRLPDPIIFNSQVESATTTLQNQNVVIQADELKINSVIFPTNDGENTQVLSTNGNGVLYWSNNTGGGGSDFTSPVLIESRFRYKIKNINTPIYSISSNDTYVKYTGTSNGTIILPNIVSSESRQIYIENSTRFICNVISQNGNTIDSIYDPIVLDEFGNFVSLQSDGVSNWNTI